MHDFSRADAPRRPGVVLPSARRRAGSHALLAGAFAALALLAPAAHAERADRTKPLSIESSGKTPDTLNLLKHSAVFTDNVVITQGTLVIHANRVELSEDPDGQQLGIAIGSPGAPATFRQKRDGDNEFSEGDAQRIEYDSAANRVRFIGAAHLRMLKGTVVTNQANSDLITYDTASETIQLTPVAGGRSTVVITPKSASSAPKPAPELALPARASEPAR
jgi:lipopolysaccharide export system protein LptA